MYSFDLFQERQESHPPLGSRIVGFFLRLIGLRRKRRVSGSCQIDEVSHEESCTCGVFGRLWKWGVDHPKNDVESSFPSITGCCCTNPSAMQFINLFGFRICIEPGDPRHTRVSRQSQRKQLRKALIYYITSFFTVTVTVQYENYTYFAKRQTLCELCAFEHFELVLRCLCTFEVCMYIYVCNTKAIQFNTRRTVGRKK